MSTKTNFRFAEAHGLLEQVELGSDRVHVRQIFETDNGGVALLGLKAGQKLETHLAPMEIMVTVLEGEIVFTVDGEPNTLSTGQFLLLGADVPHSVEARQDSKLLLVKVKA